MKFKNVDVSKAKVSVCKLGAGNKFIENNKTHKRKKW